MQRIVIDTNVIVSAFIQRGDPNLIINEPFIEQKFQLLILRGFIKTKIFKVSRFFSLCRSLISDADDNMILELADECEADFIITGNTTDFTFPIYKQTKIVTPREYWDNHQPD
ncbi:MAG: PIN domain-containing protein [Chitinophagaceae bacterium]|nr:PIN domain-containing protein [Chitinophagaceae bacterium]